MRIRTDSGVYVEGEGYERVVLFDDWDTGDPARLAQTHIRVDRTPVRSFARFAIWADDQWLNLGHLPTGSWWYDLPGFTRASQRRADEGTLDLAHRLIATLIDLRQFNKV